MMKSHLKNQFVEFVIRKNLFDPGDRVLIAVSGGVDSMVLLNLLQQWRRRLNISLGVVHLNHCLRPDSALKDQKLVEKICKDLDIPLYVLTEDVSRYAKQRKLSLEEAGHILREKLFSEIAHTHGYQKIATAHQQDDQAETVLMRILAGTGLQGLAGIRLRKGIWVRPLLDCNRNDIELYAQSKHISYRKDETNENLSFRRNKIRQVLIPLLTSEFNPEVSQHLARLSGILEEWDNYISDQVVELFSKYAQKVSQNEIIVGLPFFKLYFSWIQLTMIEFILNELQSGKKQVNFNQYQDFKHWIETGRIGSEFLWGIRLHCIKRKDRIVFRSVKEDEQLLEINIDAGKSYLLAATNIKMSLIEISRDELDYSNNPAIEFIAGDNLNFPLLLRPWNSGDLFRPLGSKFQKKVSDFLTDKKIGYPERKRIFVLLNKYEIVAVLGQQISENYRIKDRTKKIFRLKIDKVNQ